MPSSTTLWISMCIFLMTNNAKHFFHVFLKAIYVSLSLVKFLFKSFINFSWIVFILTLFLLMHSLELGHLGIKTVFLLLSTNKPCVFSLVIFHWLEPPKQHWVEVLRVDRLGFPLILGENIWCFNIKHNSS